MPLATVTPSSNDQVSKQVNKFSDSLIESVSDANKKILKQDEKKYTTQKEINKVKEQINKKK